ncbi:uncharacterized protein TNCV_3285321 [Trichonephila clavipes]|nr:uncharacterized protein TNCV_3285321 [Trichonephila clavipes]
MSPIELKLSIDLITMSFHGKELVVVRCFIRQMKSALEAMFQCPLPSLNKINTPNSDTPISFSPPSYFKLHRMDLNAGFQVKYLGSISFTRKKRRPLKGIVSLQRPLLDLYTEARRRGENHRSIHPLALTQHLEICDYGLVVAEGTNRGETVITKVITPLSNVILWAAVRFHARIIKKRVFGAAFVPLACSDGVLDHKSYICLASKQRFLVSLTHPSVFACIYRSVSSPTTYECHAFVCATAEDALAVAGLATLASQQSDLPSVRRNLYLDPPRRRIAASVDSGTDYYTPSDVTSVPRDEEDRGYGPPFRENVTPRTDTEEEDFGKRNKPGKRARRHFSQLSEFERGLIIGMKTAGWSTRHVAGQVDRSECGVKNCWEQWTREGTHAWKTGSGATRKTTRREDRRIVRLALVDPTVTRSTIRADVDVAIVPLTISRHLAEANLKSKRPFRTLPLTPEHRQLHLQWCQARSMWNVTDWQKVVFSDESRFVLGTDDNRVRVWRCPGERYISPYTVLRHTARTAGVMVWGP